MQIKGCSCGDLLKLAVKILIVYTEYGTELDSVNTDEILQQ